MKAMIFAAGLGTRLKPFTDKKPKALVEINGITLLENAVRKLQSAGVDEIIINVYHFADKTKAFLKKKKNFGIRIEISDESGKLLDTGGGLKKAAWFFDKDETFFAYNIDVISDIDLQKMYNSHLKTGAVATLAVRERETSRYFLFDDNMRLCGWTNKSTGKIRIARGSSYSLLPLAFSGIHVINPSVFKIITGKGTFSMTDVYLHLATYHKIVGFKHDEGFWMDVGKLQCLEEAAKLMAIKPGF